MKWRTVLAVLVGVMLPLPLVLLAGLVERPVPPPPSPSGRKISPVLTAEQRLRLATYRADCGSGERCEPPLGCLTELRTFRQYCTDSQCSLDAECPEGQVCRGLATAGDGPLVRVCVPVGLRQEGEFCFPLPKDREAACAEGLICGGRYMSWCARPCQKQEAAPCPEGFFCADTDPEPVCLPTCEARRCPEGKHCVRYLHGVSVCAEVYGPQCQQTPCPRGGECEASYDTAHPGKSWMECVERCGEGRPPCSAGMVCDKWLCRVPCDPKGPPSCIEGYVCRQHKPGRPFTCQPESLVP
jgi:hypothetical protein